MKVEPAHIDQIRSASDGRMVLIDADVGGVAQQLQDIDPSLKVRFAESGNPPFFAVYQEDGRDTYLILTAQAHQTASGTWTGLDQRVVDRVREIDSQSRSGYDFAAEVEAQDRAARKAKRDRFSERVGEHAGELRHALKRDLGIKDRVFISDGL